MVAVGIGLGAALAVSMGTEGFLLGLAIVTVPWGVAWFVRRNRP